MTFGEVAAAAPRDTTLFFLAGASYGAQQVVQLYGVVDSDHADTIIDRLNPFAAIGDLVQQQVGLTDYASVIGMAGDVGPEGHRGYGEPITRSALAPTITPELAQAASALVTSGASPFVQFRGLGGATTDVPADATAFAHRDAQFSLTAIGRDEAALASGWAAVQSASSGTYYPFDTRGASELLPVAFPPLWLGRLRELKRRYDPTGLFRDNVPIPPAD